MADKKETTSTPKNAGKISRFFRDMRGEVKKVVWPSKKQVVNNTVVVIVVVVVASVAIGAFDMILNALRTLLLGAF